MPRRGYIASSRQRSRAADLRRRVAPHSLFCGQVHPRRALWQGDGTNRQMTRCRSRGFGQKEPGSIPTAGVFTFMGPLGEWLIFAPLWQVVLALAVSLVVAGWLGWWLRQR